jgi:hypothetical protein
MISCSPLSHNSAVFNSRKSDIFPDYLGSHLTLFLGWLLPSLPRYDLQWAGVVYPSAAVLAISIWFYLCVTRGAHVLKAMVPRLAACIVVGLALPLATKDVWTFSFRLWEQQCEFWGLVGVLLFTSWIYLFIETLNHVGKGRTSARRAFHILLRLCNFALFFSWWITGFISTVATSLVKDHQSAVVPGSE